MRRAVFSFLLLGQCLDALTFVLFYRLAPPVSGPTEQNKVIVAAMVMGGLAGVALLKLGLGWVTCVTGIYGIPSPGFWRRAKARLTAHTPDWVRRLDRRTRLYRLALRNVLLVSATGSGFVGAAFNTVAIGKIL